VIAQLATDWTIGILGFDSRQGLGILLRRVQTGSGVHQPPILPRVLTLWIKRQCREADHTPPSIAEVKNAWKYTSSPQYIFMAWCLVKHRDNFYL